MNDRRYRWTLYVITLVMLITLGIQGYWNFKNYQAGKRQLINDVQTSLDNAVSNYYTELAKGNFIADWRRDSVRVNSSHRHFRPSHALDSTGSITSTLSLSTNQNSATIMRSAKTDSFRISILENVVPDSTNRLLVRFIDSLAKPIETLSSKIMVSFTQDSISLSKIDSLLKDELGRKNITIDYGISMKGLFINDQKLRSEIIEGAEITTTAKSPFLMSNMDMKVYFKNITISVLRRNFVGLLLSTVLILGIFSSLLYLLKIIKRQKQLAEIKNDLISNITHEFKTPLATIGVAMEGISAYNKSNDAEKNRRYSNIATEQVEKLNTMVEKLLETAALDSEKLELKVEEINLVELIRKCVLSENLTHENKAISFNSNEDEIWFSCDGFHFENAINNLLDNAVKYGGNEISATVESHDHHIKIRISDSGTNLSEAHKKQIFEKFYRVQKGNTHDVKGYGIGLYYTKKIIEKHDGHIRVETNGKTTFEIILKNA